MMESRNKAKNSFSVLIPDVAKFNPLSAAEQFPSSPSPPSQLWKCLQLPEMMPTQGTREGERLAIEIGNILPNRVPTGIPFDSSGWWVVDMEGRQLCPALISIPWGCAFTWA